MSNTIEKVALVTGASRGIGAATAQLLASSGYRVALVATSQRDLDTVAASISAVGGCARTIAGDLSDLNFAKQAIDRTCADWGRLDVLVNNAAWRELASMRRISIDSWNKTLQVCLTTPAFMARWAAEHMEPNSRGVIINVSSVMSQQAAGISPAYIASKGGLDALTYELASLYGPSGIRVVSLQLGAVDTDLSRDVESQGENGDEVRNYSKDMIMLGRWATPEEAARVILFLASEDATYITGTSITVDGGWLHQHFPLSLKQRQFREDFR